jgi:DNA-binding transcriptional MerR regulator
MSGKKTHGGEWIGAAECAARTGLSARALRVYEQRQLIKPARDGNGWRQYSGADLSRLNTIAVLKSLGLSLAEIRRQLTADVSTLEEALRTQREVWKARRAVAAETLELVDGALNHLKRHRSVPIDQMCELVRRFEMNTSVPRFRQLVATQITRAENRAWDSWWADHPNDLAESARFLEAQNNVFLKLKVAMDTGVGPDSASVRKLMRQWEALFLTYRVRERAIEQTLWNYSVTFKWYKVGHKNRVNEVDPEDSVAKTGLYTPAFASFLNSAYESSDHGQAIGSVHDAIVELAGANPDPSSIAARRIALRFVKLCSALDLGDPLIYAQFALFIERVNHGRTATRKSRSWHFLQRTLEEHGADVRRRSANTRPSNAGRGRFGRVPEEV